MARRRKEEVTEVIEEVKKPNFSGSYTTTTNVNFRRSPGDMSTAAILMVVPEGQRVTATGLDKVIGEVTWVEVLYAKKSGWMDSRFLKK